MNLTTENVTSTVAPSYNNQLDNFYGSLLVLSFLCGFLGNSLSLAYFCTKKGDVSTTLYRFVSGNDVIVSLLALPVSISYLTDRSEGVVFGNKVPCTVWMYLWASNYRLRLDRLLLLYLLITRFRGVGSN